MVSRPPLPKPGGWRDDEYEERDRWDTPKDSWSDDYDVRSERTPTRYERDKDDEVEPTPVPTAAAVAVGVHIGRWWLARKGTVATAVGVGVLATALAWL